MDKKDKAKEFMPFDTLSGFSNELARRRENLKRREKQEPDEETAIRLSETLSALKKGDSVTLTVYKDGFYNEIAGKMNYIDFAVQKISVDGKTYYFKSITDIKN